MKNICIIIMTVAIFGCGQGKTEPKETSAVKTASDRITGKTAVKAYKDTQDVLGDVQKATDSRAKDLEAFKK